MLFIIVEVAHAVLSHTVLSNAHTHKQTHMNITHTSIHAHTQREREAGLHFDFMRLYMKII